MIALDMDGVLADFEAGALAAGVPPGWPRAGVLRRDMTPAESAHDDLIRAAMSQTGFFENLPAMADAIELWDFCKRFDPVILTARPSNPENAARCEREKRAWVNRVLGPVPDSHFICTVASLKHTFIGHRPGQVQVLVDDSIANCSDWCRAGGYAVLHTSAADSIRRIEMILGEVGHLSMA